MIHPTLADGESFVEGRSIDTAKELLELAGEDRSHVVVTTSHGYIVPSDILPEGYDAVTNADTAAVITQPGTSTNVEEVWNVGGAPKPAAKPEAAAADAEADEAEDENPEGLQFDPSTATVDAVKEYLDGADDEERARVLEVEAASAKPRKGILDLATVPEGAK